MKIFIINLVKNFLRPLTKNFIYTYKIIDTPIKIKGGLGLGRFKSSPTKEELFINSLDYTSKVCYDIGGYIGIFAVLFGKKAGSKGMVYTFEPNPDLVKRIHTNLNLNEISNCTVLNIGIADEKKTRTLTVRKHLAATGSMNENIQSTILKEDEAESLQVHTDTLDHIIKIQNLQKPDFIKIDIEGMEYPALLGMKETLSKIKPELYIEIHGASESDKIDNVSKVVEYLLELDYSITHIETDTAISNENAPIAKEGHLYCT